MEDNSAHLHVIDLILFPIVLLHLIFQEFHPSPYECVIVSSVIFKPLFINMYDICTDTIQEILRMRNQNQNPLVAVIL